MNIHLDIGQLMITCNMGINSSKLGPYAILLQERTCDPLYKHEFSAWINNHIHQKLFDEITYPFPIFNGAVVDICEWINNLITHFVWSLIHTGNQLKYIHAC